MKTKQRYLPAVWEERAKAEQEITNAGPRSAGGRTPGTGPRNEVSGSRGEMS